MKAGLDVLKMDVCERGQLCDVMLVHGGPCVASGKAGSIHWVCVLGSIMDRMSFCA